MMSFSGNLGRAETPEISLYAAARTRQHVKVSAIFRDFTAEAIRT